MKTLNKAQLAMAIGSLTLASAATASDKANPFVAQQLTMAYQISSSEAKCGADKAKQHAKTKADKAASKTDKASEKSKEMKCGEGMCGEGMCGADMAKDKASDKAADKAQEMKCGEGKCGADKAAKHADQHKQKTQDKAKDTRKKAADKAKEHKCGEGKCGAA